MARSQGSSPRPPRSRSPAERSAEFAEVQRRLKHEAAERRLRGSRQTADAPPPKSSEDASPRRP
jgi:hypothetical protein